MTTTKAQQIINAIEAGLNAGGDRNDWDAPEFADAVLLTGQAGCVWDFESWPRTLQTVRNHACLGGINLVSGEKTLR